MWYLLIEYDIKVIRGEYQNVVSKDHKLQQSSKSKENRSNFMI